MPFLHPEEEEDNHNNNSDNEHQRAAVLTHGQSIIVVIKWRYSPLGHIAQQHTLYIIEFQTRDHKLLMPVLTLELLNELSANERRMCESDVEVRERKVALAHLRAKVKTLKTREKSLKGKFS